MLLTDKSAATRDKFSLVAAGVAFGVIVAALPSARPVAMLVLLMAWGAAAWWLE